MVRLFLLPGFEGLNPAGLPRACFGCTLLGLGRHEPTRMHQE